MTDYIYRDPETVNEENMVYTFCICDNPTPSGYTNMYRRLPPVFEDQDGNIIPFTFAWVYKYGMWMWVGTRKDTNGCTIPPTFDEDAQTDLL